VAGFTRKLGVEPRFVEISALQDNLGFGSLCASAAVMACTADRTEAEPEMLEMS
jgi:hypothetical protein